MSTVTIASSPADAEAAEKVEQHLRDRFPDARIGRVDRDSVRRKGGASITCTTERCGPRGIAPAGPPLPSARPLA